MMMATAVMMVVWRGGSMVRCVLRRERRKNEKRDKKEVMNK
jgi:hypothetical protein